MKHLTILGFLLALTASPVASQTIDTRAIGLADIDDDGVVEESEFLTQMNKLFDVLDANGNGGIGWSEARVAISIELFREADADGNGYISVREFNHQVREDFDFADKNGDGVLD